MEKYLKKKLKNGSFGDVSAVRSKTMGRIKGKGNKTTELKLKMALVRRGISGYRLHPKEIDGKPDLYFYEKKLAVFLDGCFWHGCPKCGHIPKTNNEFWKAKILRNKERDRKNRKKLNRKGIKVLRLWEHQINNDVEHCVNAIIKKLDLR